MRSAAAILRGLAHFAGAALLCAFAMANANAQTPGAPASAAALRNDAFENAQRAMSGAAANALAQLGARFAAGSDDLAAAVRRRQDLIEAWKRADKQLVQATTTQASFLNVEDLRTQVAQLEAQVTKSDADIAQRFPAYSDLAVPRPLSIERTQALLERDEALVMILVGSKETFAFALTREADEIRRVPIGKKSLIPRVRALRRGLDPQAPAITRSALRNMDDTVLEMGGETGRAAFSRQEAFSLYEAFLAGFEPLLHGKTRVFYVLETPFDSLPLSLLVTAPPQGSDTDPADLRATQWLIRRHAAVVLPSVGSLQALRGARNRTRAPEPFRGYGAPLIGKQTGNVQVATRSAGAPASILRAGKVDVEAVRALSALPQTEGELQRLAAALGAPPSSVRTGAAATVAAVKADDLSRYRVLAFATHGLLAGELAGLSEPALVFTPPADARADDNGLLTSSDAAKLNLSADWVILSACNTAAGDGNPGAEGLSGLARAFFYAGARSLLVSHWPVRDDAAARITTGTFRRIAENPSMARADAFRLSVIELMEDASDPTFAHPAVWAPFVIVGEGQ
ncbi:MAG: CHAT domain-containing protein [Beijerinckiaceae bacterium]|nr:CHAT domain-containing protein [Beijerinckiaceae bacterium]